MSFNKSFDDLTVKHPVLSSAIILSNKTTANGTLQYTDGIKLNVANAWNLFLSLDINAINVADMDIQMWYSLSTDDSTYITAVEIDSFVYTKDAGSVLNTYGAAFDPSALDIDTYPYIKFGYEVTMDASTEAGTVLGSLLVLGTRPMDIDNVTEVATLV